MSESDLQQKQQAARTHGIHAFERRGADALDPLRVGRLAELRSMVEDAPGRMELRRELTARMALIAEIGFAHLREQAEQGADIWDGGIIRRLSTYVAETRRLLDTFSDLPAGLDAEHYRIEQVLENESISGRAGQDESDETGE